MDLNLPDLWICVTSCPEIDIQIVLEPLTSHKISLHDERGQKKDILDYIRHVVMTDRKMWRWRPEDKQLVIDTLSANADGMYVMTVTAPHCVVFYVTTQVSMDCLPAGYVAPMLSSKSP